MTRQTEIPGTETPKNPDIEHALDMWLEAKDEQRRAADAVKLRHATLLLHLQNVGCDAYPYVDPKTGKKKQVVVARDPRAKVVKAPKWNRKDVDVGDEVTPEEKAVEKAAKKAKAEAERVETRRVKRKDVEGEIDPFASTRSRMNGQS
jgi:hypothetical protein